MECSQKKIEIDKVAKEVAASCCCGLGNLRTNPVPGDGSACAKIMFIGEAPGANEDLQGKPFVGAAGKFLAEMLASIGLNREDVFITNVLKCRPPNNRDPLPEEKAACMPYLQRQIEIINPVLIVLLGRHAMENFIPKAQISKVHGQPKKVGGRIYLPLYHPAAALYNGSQREILKEDFKKIPEVFKKAEQLLAQKERPKESEFQDPLF